MMSVPANSSHAAAFLRSDYTALVQPPLNARLPAIAKTISDGVEENVGAINSAINAAHALVCHNRLNCGARGWVEKRYASAAVRVGVAESSHELVWESNGVVGVGVNGCATSTKTTIPVSNVANAGVGRAFAGTTRGGSDISRCDSTHGLGDRIC